jgi:putative ATPase
MPENLSNSTFFEPLHNPNEEKIRAQLKNMWKEKYGY